MCLIDIFVRSLIISMQRIQYNLGEMFYYFTAQTARWHVQVDEQFHSEKTK